MLTFTGAEGNFRSENVRNKTDQGMLSHLAGRDVSSTETSRRSSDPGPVQCSVLSLTVMQSLYDNLISLMVSSESLFIKD